MEAYYDQKPDVLQAAGNGSYLYRYNIEEVTQEQENETISQWKCEEVRVWAPLSANKIVAAVLTDKWAVNSEQKYQNEYNAAQMGIYDEATAAEKVEAYKTFLSERAKLKAAVESDCEALGVK